MADFERHRETMVARQIAERGINNDNILRAFAEVPREEFVPEEMREFAYRDGPLPIGDGQTISQPAIVAQMIEAAEVEESSRVLEVGAGSGYAAAVMSRIANQVYAIERHDRLARQAQARMKALNYTNCEIISGDGLKGLDAEAPFDAILVAARSDSVPETLKRQLRIGGTMVIPVGSEDVQSLRCIRRLGQDEWTEQDLGLVRFVPLLPGTVAEDGSQAASDHRPARELSVAEVIAREGEKLPEITDPDFAQAFAHFADKRVVMLGECSHGTYEFYAARAAITRLLVEKHGFGIVAIEGDWPDAAAFNRYIRRKKTRSEEKPPFQRFPTWMWRNEVMPGFLNELRAINDDRDEDDQVGFYGLDIYNMSGSIEAVLAYLDEKDPEAAQIARERYACLTPWQSDPAVYGRAALTKGYAECEEAVVQQCREMLENALEADGDSFGAAMNARLVASAERYYRVMYSGGAKSWNLRDSHMAETLEHLLEKEGPDSKAIVWAHNSHIGDARATEMGAVRGEHNIGQLARERWGDDVALIGFGTHSGTVSAASDWDGEREVKTVLPSRSDSYERLFHESGCARLLLNFSKSMIARRRLHDPRLERFIGVIYRPETERWSHYSQAHLSDQFDAYCWFEKTRALEPLDASQPNAGVPETFPFGV